MKKYYDTFTGEYTYHPNLIAPPERYVECGEDNVQNRVIYAVLTTHDAGWEGEQKRIKELDMKIGDKFTVNNIAIGSWNTDVYLDEFPDDYFNSVFFDFTDEDGNEVDIFKCEEFY